MTDLITKVEKVYDFYSKIINIVIRNYDDDAEIGRLVKELVKKEAKK